MYLDYYLEQLDYSEIPNFLIKYLNTPSLLRLKKVGYFCGMDYASKDIYHFSEYISRFDHSLTVSLIVYKLTHDKTATVAGLFHDIATPCFSHVIDYMNEDFENQESIEEYTELILRQDEYLKRCLDEDNICIEDIINFKKHSIVDNDRPKVCADRIDGVILTGFGWTNNISQEDIKDIVKSLRVYKNEYGEDEIGLDSLEIAQKVLDASRNIDVYCHSREDNYMMILLARITKLAILKKYISYHDLFFYNEEELFHLLEEKKDIDLESLLQVFKSISKNEITDIEIPNVKVRKLNPLVNGKRIY